MNRLIEEGTSDFECSELDENGVPVIGSSIIISLEDGELYNGVVRDCAVTESHLIMRVELSEPMSHGGRTGRHLVYDIPLDNLEFEKVQVH